MALDVDPVDVTGSWVRHVPAGVDPAQRPYPPADNRWQRGHVVDAVYLADSTSCAWAERYRALAEAAIPPTVALSRDLWLYELHPLRVADLSGRDQLARVDLSSPQPGRRNWSPFQAVGEQLHDEGWRGLVAPSAARPASRILVIFLQARLPIELAAVGRTRVSEPPAPPTGMQHVEPRDEGTLVRNPDLVPGLVMHRQ